MVRVEELTLDEAVAQAKNIRFQMTNTCRDVGEAANLGADLADIFELLDSNARRGHFPKAWQQ